VKNGRKDEESFSKYTVKGKNLAVINIFKQEQDPENLGKKGPN